MIRGPAMPGTPAGRPGSGQLQRRKADKAFATLQVRAALAGAQLVRSTDDRGRETFIVSQWALTAQFETMAEVSEWLQQVEELAS